MPITSVNPQNLSYQNKINKSNLLKMSNLEKIKYVDRMIITYNLMDKILAKIEECQSSILYSEQPECLSLIGPTRSGKTTIISQHKKKYPDIIEQDITIKQILYCVTPCPADIGGLVSKLLESIGDPFYIKGTRNQKTARLANFIKECKVKLIILDEVQHLVDRERQTLIKESADWFKTLIIETNVPVVFVGLPDSRKIFYENSQLSSRVLNRFEINDFDPNDKTFRAILHYFDSYLPLKSYSGLSEPNIWERIHIATHGRFGYIKILIKECAKIAIEKNFQRISLDVLSEAFEAKLSHIFSNNRVCK